MEFIIVVELHYENVRRGMTEYSRNEPVLNLFAAKNEENAEKEIDRLLKNPDILFEKVDEIASFYDIPSPFYNLRKDNWQTIKIGNEPLGLIRRFNEEGCERLEYERLWMTFREVEMIF